MPHRELIRRGGGPTVLLVEAHDALRRVTAGVLCSLGYTVLDARSGRDAEMLASAWNRPVHVLFTDVALPDMDGERLFETLRASQPSLRVVFCARGGDRAVAGALGSGHLVIRKPCTAATIARALRGVLEEGCGGTRH